MKYQFKEFVGCHPIVTEHLPKELQQNAIIAEMKEVLTHIPDNKLAGYPEKLRKLAEKLTRL